MATYSSFVRGALIATIAAGTAGAQVSADSMLVAARRAGVLTAQQRSPGGWFVTGVVVPPLLFAASAIALANQRNHPYAVPAAVVFDAGVIFGMRRLIRRTSTPSDALVSNTIGTASDAERAAFIESHRPVFYQRSATQYREGMVFSGITLGIFTVLVFRGLSGT